MEYTLAHSSMFKKKQGWVKQIHYWFKCGLKCTKWQSMPCPCTAATSACMTSLATNRLSTSASVRMRSRALSMIAGWERWLLGNWAVGLLRFLEPLWLLPNANQSLNWEQSYNEHHIIIQIQAKWTVAGWHVKVLFSISPKMWCLVAWGLAAWHFCWP